MPWAEALVIGVLLSLAFSHWTGWTPGGLITPGYLVLYLGDWPSSMWMIATAALTWAIALGARRWLPLFGRRRWGFCVGTSVALRAAAEGVAGRVTALHDPLGLVVPGLIASSLLGQGFGPTATALVTVTATTWWALLLGGWM